MEYPNSYKATFATIVNTSSVDFSPGLEIHSFLYGEGRRIEEALKSEIQYPALWAELPEYSYTSAGDNVLKNISVAFMILISTSIDDYESQDDIIDKSIKIAEKVMKYFFVHDYLHKDDTVQIEPIITTFSDNSYGCRVTFQIKRQETSFLC